MGSKQTPTRQATAYSGYAQKRVDAAQLRLERAQERRTTAYDDLQQLEALQVDGYVSEELAHARTAADKAEASVARATAVLADAQAKLQAPTLAGLE